jgi:hypothetical protein
VILVPPVEIPDIVFDERQLEGFGDPAVLVGLKLLDCLAGSVAPGQADLGTLINDMIPIVWKHGELSPSQLEGWDEASLEEVAGVPEGAQVRGKLQDGDTLGEEGEEGWARGV